MRDFILKWKVTIIWVVAIVFVVGIGWIAVAPYLNTGSQQQQPTQSELRTKQFGGTCSRNKRRNRTQLCLLAYAL